MIGKIIGAGLVTAVLLGLAALNALTAEKARWGVHFRENPYYGLPAWAAYEKGFWQEQGLEVEIVEFGSAAVLVTAVAAGAVDVGTHGIESVPLAISRGVPQVIVADPKMSVEFVLWVLTDSPLKKLEDLKGGNIGVSRLGTTPHRLAQIAVERAGLKGQVKFVAAGGGAPLMAALKARRVDSLALSYDSLINLKAAGEVRLLVSLNKLVPEAAYGQVIFAHTEFLKKNPEAVRKAVRGFIQGADFVLKNKEWALSKMVTRYRYSPEGAKMAFDNFQYGREGKIDVEKIKRAMEYLVATGLMAKDKAPPLEKVYVKGFDE